jgi:sugar O-acyltransferase (sialic acid O-acetyltransferase NeuD family)
VKQKLVIFGDGGHARAVADVALSSGEFEIAAVVGLNTEHSMYWLRSGIPWIAEPSFQESLFPGAAAIVGIGQIRDSDPRVRTYEKILSLGLKAATIISPHSYVSATADLGEGTIVMHGAVVNSNSRVGANTILNSKALVEHDVTVGSHSHISTGAIINGSCSIGDRSFLGSGAVIRQGVRVGSNCFVPMGALVVLDLPDGLANEGSEGKLVD